MAKVFKWANGKRYVGNVESTEVSTATAPIFRLLKMLVAALSDLIGEHRADATLRLRSKTFTTVLDKVPPSYTEIEYDAITCIDNNFFVLDSNKTDVTIKRSGIYLVSVFMTLDTTSDGDAIRGGIYRKKPYGNWLCDRISATGTATLGTLVFTEVLHLYEGEIITLRTQSITGFQMGIKKKADEGYLTIKQLTPIK